MPRPPLPEPDFPLRQDYSSCHERFCFLLDQGLTDLRSKLLSAVEEYPWAVAQKSVVLKKKESKEKLTSFADLPKYSRPHSSAPSISSQTNSEYVSDDETEDAEVAISEAERSSVPVIWETPEEQMTVDVKDSPPKNGDHDGDGSAIATDLTITAPTSPLRCRSESGDSIGTKWRSKATNGNGIRPSFMHLHHFGHLLHSTRFGLVHPGILAWRRYQESIAMLLICSNSIWMGWHLQYHAESGKEMAGAETVDLGFCIAFVFEILVRLSADGWKEFWKGSDNHWNIFDGMVVCVMVVEELGRRTIGEDDSILAPVPILRVLRMLRCIRILRAVRLFRALDFFRSGRLLIMSIIKTWTQLFWIIMILLSLVYVLALIVSFGTLPHCAGSESDADDHVSRAPEYREACHHFGTLWKSCVSLYQAMTLGIPWSTLYNALKVLDAQYALLLVAAITFDITIIHNVFSAIFVCQVLATSEVEKQHTHYDDQLRKRKMFMSEMVTTFHKLDVNQNGALCKDELAAMFETMSASLASMDLDTNAAETLFELLDADGSGHVKIDEFVVGCLKLQGKARAVDLERVSRDVQDVLNILKRKEMMKLSSAKKKRNSPPKVGPIPTFASGLTKFGSTSFHSSSVNKLTSMKDYSQVGQLRQNKRVYIPKVEMRAMLLSELEDVVAIIQSACSTEMWTDPRSFEGLTPETVNLYHYNFHVISPVTADRKVTISGLIHGRYEQGDVMMQQYDGVLIGQAEVLVSTEGTEVQVVLTKGQLSARSSVIGQDCNITINGVDCGIPESISNKDSVSYKELLPSNATRPDWFCTHWWGEPIIEFVDCCRAHSQARKTGAYWVCAYANRQHDLGLDVSDDPEESSFRRSMKLAEGVLLVLDDRAVPFHRIWCDFELYKTVCDPTKMLDIITFKGKPRLLTETPLPGEHDVEKTQREHKFPLQLLSKGAQLCLELGKATVEQDKLNILNSMGRDPSTGRVDDDLLKMNVDRANRALRAYFAVAAWPQALKRGLVRNFSFGKEEDDFENVKLPDILADDEERTSLQLSLSSLEEVDDVEMESIANGLPHGLKDLQLSFENCVNITDIGVSALAESFHRLSLQKLRLDFVSCRKLTDSSINALAMNLPKTLTDIRLDFAFCSLITRAGVAHLAAHLPKGVKHFTGTFRGTKCDEDFDSVKKMKKLMQS